MGFDAAHAATARADFPALARLADGRPLAWFDAPGGTQVPQAVIEAVSRVFRECNVNLGGAFETSRAAGSVVQAARVAAADFLGASSPAQISLGANMTTLNFALAHALGRRLQAGDEIIVTALDHEANRGPWLGLAERGAIVHEARLTPGGTLDLDHLASLVSPRTKIIAVGIASNALGTVTPFAPIREIAQAYGALTVVDAVHYAAHLPLDFEALGCDFLLCSAYKFYGPHVGILCSRAGLLDTLEPDRVSVQQQEAPHRIETGTPNIAALAGVTAAVDYLARIGEGGSRRERLLDAMQALAAYEHMLAARYAAGLDGLDGITCHGPALSTWPRAPTVSFARPRGVAPLAAELGRQGIQVWHGHFYARRVIESFGLADQGGLLRVGFALYNTPDEVDRLLATLRAALAGGL